MNDTSEEKCMPSECPHCGADWDPDFPEGFFCETYYGHDGKEWRSDPCRWIEKTLAILRPKAEAMDRLEEMVEITDESVSVDRHGKTWFAERLKPDGSGGFIVREFQGPDLPTAIAAAFEQFEKGKE